MSDELEASRGYLQWQSRQYVVVFRGDESLGVMDDGTLAPEWERGESPYTGPWVAIPRQHVERSYRRGCSAVWDGQRVEVIGLDDPLVRVAWAGPASWGEAHDLQGSQYDGWQGWAPIDELTDIRVDESDYPPWTGPRRGVPLTNELRLAGDYLLWGGRDHLVSFSGDDWVAVLDDGSFPPEWERGENGGGRWVKVPKRRADRFYRRDVRAGWNAREVMITRVNIPWAFIEWSGPAVWAEAHGLSGSEDEGWRGWVRIDELANVGVIESDHRLPLP